MNQRQLHGFVAIVCFFGSGFAGLVYEVCWIRQATLVVGSTSFALSTVVAAFFAGLAMGSWLFGRYAQQISRPLRLYAVLEVLLAALALTTPWAFGLADQAYGWVYRSFSNHPGWLFAVRALLVGAVLIPPTFLMGGTLPLFCRQFVAERGRIAGSVGFLYGVNTLGAAIGCALTGFFLLPRLGVNTSIQLAVALNVAVGVLAGLLPLRVTPATAISRSAPTDRRRSLIIHVLFFFTGFVALGTQVMWTRFLGLLVRNTVYTYTITLTVVLVGIVLGSMVAGRLFDRSWPRATCFAVLQVLGGLAALTLMMLPAQIWQEVSHEWLTYVLLMLPAAILSGATFPLAIRMVVNDPDLAAIGVGRLSAVNTLGGIGGSLLVALLGLPWLGLAIIARLLSGISVAVGGAAWLMLGSKRPARISIALAAACLATWLAIPPLMGTRLPADYLAGHYQLIDYEEGYVSNLAVVNDRGVKQLQIDRFWQGQDKKSHQIMAAHIPALLHPDPQKVLVVGAGTGQTPSRFLLYGIDQLDCVDLEPRVFGMIERHFDSAWMKDRRVNVIREDGRTFLSHGSSRYDIISLEVGQLFRPGVATFYTADFYKRARSRLKPGGLLGQFVPLPFLTEAQFRRVLGSFQSVFPHCALWYNTSELLLIGVNGERIEFETSRLDLLADREIHEDLRYSYWGGPAQWLNRLETFLAGFLCGSEGIARISSGHLPYRDDRPELEYATSQVNITHTDVVALVELLERHLEPLGVLLDHPPPQEIDSQIVELRNRNLRDIVAHTHLLQVDALTNSVPEERITTLLENALHWNPSSVVANRKLALILASKGQGESARQHFQKALDVNPYDTQSTAGLAMTHLQNQRFDIAVPLLESVLRTDPEFAQGHYLLGVTLINLKRHKEGLKHLERAIELDPDFKPAHKAMAKLRR